MNTGQQDYETSLLPLHHGGVGDSIFYFNNLSLSLSPSIFVSLCLSVYLTISVCLFLFLPFSYNTYYSVISRPPSPLQTALFIAVLVALAALFTATEADPTFFKNKGGGAGKGGGKYGGGGKGGGKGGLFGGQGFPFPPFGGFFGKKG